MQLVITLDGKEGAAVGERLAKAVLILGGSDAVVSRPLEGFVFTSDEVKSLENHVSDPKDVALRTESGTDVSLEEAAALLSGGATPLPAADSATQPASSSSSVVAPPPATATPAAELDSAGMPWDERIHSGARSKKKDGTWTSRRNLADGVVEKVEAELHAEGFGTAPNPVAPPPAAGVIPPPSAVAPPPTAAPVAADPEAFRKLVSELGTLMTGGQLTKAALDGAVATLGLKALPELQARPDLIPNLRTILGL